MRKSTYEIVQEYYKKIKELEPTYEEIKAFVETLKDPYGVVTYTRRDDNPLHIRFHDTWRIKFGGRIHIDAVSGEFHLMLDKRTAPEFIKFIESRRKIQKSKNLENSKLIC